MTDNKKTYLKWMSPSCFLIAVLFFVFLKFLLAQILTYFVIKFFILSRFNHTSQFLYSRLMFLKSCFMVGKMCKSQLNYMVSGILTSKNPFWCNRCKHCSELAGVNFLLFLIHYQEMLRILSSNACKLTLIIALRLLNFWSIHM